MMHVRVKTDRPAEGRGSFTSPSAMLQSPKSMCSMPRQSPAASPIVLHQQCGWALQPQLPSTPEGNLHPKQGTTWCVFLLNYYTYLMLLRTLSAVEER